MKDMFEVCFINILYIEHMDLRVIVFQEFK